MNGHAKPLNLFADGLTLVYHEGRNARHLIRDGHLFGSQWAKIVSLPKNRVAAWKGLQPFRHTASSRLSAYEAAQVFARRFNLSLEQLERLYENPNWKHTRRCGGNAWKQITALASNLGQVIDRNDPSGIHEAATVFLEADHNNGALRTKILELDRAIGAVTGSWWQDEISEH